MKARKDALPIPEGRRFWSVNLGTEEAPDVHHFKMPRFTVACALQSLSLAAARVLLDPDTDSHHYAAVKTQKHAALIGACWHSRGLLLEAPPPTPDPKELADYGELVIEELTDRFDLDQVETMGNRAAEEVASRLPYVLRAAELAKGFTAAEAAAEPLQAAPATSQSPEK